MTGPNTPSISMGLGWGWGWGEDAWDKRGFILGE